MRDSLSDGRRAVRRGHTGRHVSAHAALGRRVVHAQPVGPVGFVNVNYNQDGDTLNTFVMAVTLAGVQAVTLAGVQAVTLAGVQAVTLAGVQAVTLAGVQDGFWAVEGGNHEVCRGLLDKADVALRHQAVTAVQRLDQASPFAEFQVSAGSGEADVFDAVVIPTPLQLSGIELNGFPHSASTMHRGEYQRTVVTFVVGQPSNEYFGLD